MLNNIEFDLWADGYDKTVGISDEENTYPFAGYKKVLGFIFQTIMRAENAVVLDIGFGTGTLTAKLYERGCSIYGQDFSSRMIALASEKMPNAHLYQGDFSKGLVEPLRNFRYYYIVSSSFSFRYLPVMLFLHPAISSGVPQQTMLPPLSPPSGPRSMT